jgi:hypothetical protein
MPPANYERLMTFGGLLFGQPSCFYMPQSSDSHAGQLRTEWSSRGEIFSYA